MPVAVSWGSHMNNADGGELEEFQCDAAPVSDTLKVRKRERDANCFGRNRGETRVAEFVSEPVLRNHVRKMHKRTLQCNAQRGHA